MICLGSIFESSSVVVLATQSHHDDVGCGSDGKRKR